jgi:hypothetical protein
MLTQPYRGVRHRERLVERTLVEIVDDGPSVFAPSCFWNVPLPNVAIDPATAAVSADLVRQASVAAPYVNTWQYTAEMVVVPADQPLVPVALLGDRTDTPFVKLKAMMATGLPIPADWQPQADSDAEGCFYQPDYVSPYLGQRGRLYEGWKLAKGPDGWTAQWGGRMTNCEANPGHFVSWEYSGYQYTNPGHPDSTYQNRLWGTTATSLPLLGGTITVEDLRQGRIEHAVGLSVIVPRQGARWPAQRNDGTSSTNPVIEGRRMRFPAAAVAPAGLHPVAALIFDAVRDFGLVVWDKAGALTFRAEPAVDFGGVAGYDVLDGFPWGDLQVFAIGSDANPNP